MAFEDLREQLKDRASEALAKLQESSTFNSLRERYESQTPPMQKAVLAGGIALAFLMVLWFPMSFLSSGSDQISQAEENRDLIKGLLRASHSASEPAPLPPPMSADTLKSSVERVLRDNGLLPDQIGIMNPIPESANGGLAPAGVVTTGLAVQLKKLNVAQVIEIGNLVQNMAPGTKLIGVDVIQSAGTTHYYDLVLQILHFGLPTMTDDTEAAPNGKGAKQGRSGKSKPADADSE